MTAVSLREVADADLPIFFALQRDMVAVTMAGVESRDRTAFDEHWARIRSDPSVVLRTVVADGEVVGNVVSFVRDDEREIGYWIARQHWGRGIATAALGAFLLVETRRPLHAGVLPGNAGSLRVLEKHGFALTGGGGEELLHLTLV
jgi:RimJ/RimL family protein N-acetyltransferase